MPENSVNIAQESLEKDGFVVLESILSSEECLNYKNLLEQHYSDFSNLFNSAHNSRHSSGIFVNSKHLIYKFLELMNSQLLMNH